MTTLSIDFKRKVAEKYLKRRIKLEKFDPTTMETFSEEILEMVNKEKNNSKALHDLEILEYNMKLLQNYSIALMKYESGTDEFDFTQNDCKNIIDSTKKWLKLEGFL